VELIQKIRPRRRIPGLTSAWNRLRGRTSAGQPLTEMPCLPVAAGKVQTLDSPVDYRETILALIAQAKKRILIAALYLQDDDAGREVLAALYAAKKAQPQLEVSVFVDWHRAQRGLIGKVKSEGNAALYRSMAERFGPGVTVYGVPVQRRELMGVLHLKGLVIDDHVLYSGASLNDVYLQRHGRYRLDRYHLIDDAALADSLAGLLNTTFILSPAVHPLDSGQVPKTVELRAAIAQFRRALVKARYHYADDLIKPGQVGITPLLGLGVRGNELNTAILQLLRQVKKQLVIFTPYFNLPGPIRRLVDQKIKAGCHVTIILGDKTANDFYIPPSEPFSTIGGLPYLYEVNLRRFAERFQRYLDNGQLNLMLWRHEQNSFHLKGISVDGQRTLITGSNLNPRAWALDLENGLLLQDPKGLLVGPFAEERQQILEHTSRLNHFTELERLVDYPEAVRRLLVRLQRFKAHLLLKQLL